MAQGVCLKANSATAALMLLILSAASAFSQGPQLSFQQQLEYKLEADFGRQAESGKKAKGSSPMQVFEKILRGITDSTKRIDAICVPINGSNYTFDSYSHLLPVDISFFSQDEAGKMVMFTIGLKVSFAVGGRTVAIQDEILSGIMSFSAFESGKANLGFGLSPSSDSIEAVVVRDSAVDFTSLSPRLQALMETAYRRVLDSASAKLKGNNGAQQKPKKQQPHDLKIKKSRMELPLPDAEMGKMAMARMGGAFSRKQPAAAQLPRAKI